jgi:hypothetical protein
MASSLKLPPVPVWEPRWTPENLQREAERNPRAFARGFRMQAYSDEELMFPSFKSCYSRGLVVGEVSRRGWPVFVGVDLASDRRPGNVIVALAMDPQTRRRVPLEIVYGAWTSPETAQQISQLCGRHPNVRYIMVENNAYQQSLIDWIRHACKDYASFWMKVESFTTGKNKADPQYGLPSLEVEFKNQAWAIPYDEFGGHSPSCRCGWCLWTSQMTMYPRGARDDAVMACWFAREAIDRWGGVGSAALTIGDLNTR